MTTSSPPMIRLPQMPQQESVDVGILVGNGSSRAGFDLHRLDGQGLVVGCNYLYRDYDPDYIVAIDEEIVDDIRAHLRAKLNHRWKMLARVYLDGRFWWLCADQEKVVRFASINHRLNQNSGILGAYFLAHTMTAKRLYLFGVDFFRPVPDADNDMYFGHIPFKPKVDMAWNRVIADHPDTEFIRVGSIPERDREWVETNIVGMTFINYEELPF